MKTIIIALLLSGCATLPGVEITDDERKACEALGCTVWTVPELQRLGRKFWGEGYAAGKKSI